MSRLGRLLRKGRVSLQLTDRICGLSARDRSSRGQGERSDRRSRSHECARQRARRRNARPVSNFVMLLRVTALAAAAAASAPPFVTATALRPARRAQDFAECPVLTKIKKDDCTDVKDFDALPVCSDSCLCKGMHCRAEVTEYCGSEDKGSGHHNCASAASLFLARARKDDVAEDERGATARVPGPEPPPEGHVPAVPRRSAGSRGGRRVNFNHKFRRSSSSAPSSARRRAPAPPRRRASTGAAL